MILAGNDASSKWQAAAFKKSAVLDDDLGENSEAKHPEKAPKVSD